MDITGDPNGPPMKVGTSIADLVTGLYATQAVLAALRQRDRTGCAGIPSGEIRSVGDVCEAPQLQEQEKIGEHDHPVADRVWW